MTTTTTPPNHLVGLASCLFLIPYVLSTRVSPRNKIIPPTDPIGSEKSYLCLILRHWVDQRIGFQIFMGFSKARFILDDFLFR